MTYFHHLTRITGETFGPRGIRIVSAHLMDRRRQPRVTTAFPVRIWGMDANSRPFMQLATVSNISECGALLNGVRRPLMPGGVVDVQYDDVRAEFVVVWAGAGEAGLVNQPSQPRLWDSYLDRAWEFVGKG